MSDRKHTIFHRVADYITDDKHALTQTWLIFFVQVLGCAILVGMVATIVSLVLTNVQPKVEKWEVPYNEQVVFRPRDA